MDQLLQKLMISKAIMDKHNEIPRGQKDSIASSINVENFEAPSAKFNIPQDLLQEDIVTPKVNTKTAGMPTVDAIKNSKLPDAIKRLMMENPIQTPQDSGAVLSDELVEKASRLMKRDSPASTVKETKQVQQYPSDLSTIIKKAVNEALAENGLLVESVDKTNDSFSFRVGSHIFEGKVTKVKKVK